MVKLKYEKGEVDNGPRLDRLVLLQEHLERGKLGHRVFSFKHWNKLADGEFHTANRCGTLGCAVGELPVLFPESFSFGGKSENKGSWGNVQLIGTEDNSLLNWTAAADFFHITEDEAEMLFIPQIRREFADGTELDDSASRYEVAKSIELFIKWVKSGERDIWCNNMQEGSLKWS